MPFVADNSVVIAWFSRSQATPYTDKLFRRLEEDEVRVPSVWPYEFANAVAALERRGILRGELADEIVATAARLIPAIDSPPAAPATLLALSRQHALSAYDAAYLELALRLRLPLATKDEALVAVSRNLGVLAV